MKLTIHERAVLPFLIIWLGITKILRIRCDCATQRRFRLHRLARLSIICDVSRQSLGTIPKGKRLLVPLRSDAFDGYPGRTLHEEGRHGTHPIAQRPHHLCRVCVHCRNALRLEEASGYFARDNGIEGRGRANLPGLFTSSGTSSGQGPGSRSPRSLPGAGGHSRVQATPQRRCVPLSEGDDGPCALVKIV